MNEEELRRDREREILRLDTTEPYPVDTKVRKKNVVDKTKIRCPSCGELGVAKVTETGEDGAYFACKECFCQFHARKSDELSGAELAAAIEQRKMKISKMWKCPRCAKQYTFEFYWTALQTYLVCLGSNCWRCRDEIRAWSYRPLKMLTIKKKDQSGVYYYDIPKGLYYPDYQWMRVEGGQVYVGMTHLATEAFPNQVDAVSIELPNIGTVTKRHKPYGKVKTEEIALDLLAPINGKVNQVNRETCLQDSQSGEWLVIVTPNDLDEAKGIIERGDQQLREFASLGSKLERELYYHSHCAHCGAEFDNIQYYLLHGIEPIFCDKCSKMIGARAEEESRRNRERAESEARSREREERSREERFWREYYRTGGDVTHC